MQRTESTVQKPDLLTSLKDQLETINHLPPASGCSIYRVPPAIRKMNEEAYNPMVVSIGPYHHGDKRLESMENTKLWFLNKFLKRTSTIWLQDYVRVVRDWEGEIRRCYSEIIPMESDEFVSMILTDACFIIEYFLTSLGLADDDTMHSKPWLPTCINLDLIKFENQLPYFVLQNLFHLAFPTAVYYDGSSFVKITFSNLYGLLISIIPDEKLRQIFTFEYFEQHHLPKLPDGSAQVQHLCDMLRMFYIRRDAPTRGEGTKMKPVYSASKLNDAGVVFKVAEDKISLIDVQYSKGVLKIPRITINDWTEPMLRNVVAFEQCHLPWSSYMIDYVIFLEYLISNGKDVDMLVEKGIIQNIIGESNAAASITRRLGRHVSYANFNSKYISLFEELNKFYDNPCHKYKAIFKREYLSTPWKMASFFGAIVLLLLTLIQTICSVMGM